MGKHKDADNMLILSLPGMPDGAGAGASGPGPVFAPPYGYLAPLPGRIRRFIDLTGYDLGAAAASGADRISAVFSDPLLSFFYRHLRDTDDIANELCAWTEIFDFEKRGRRAFRDCLMFYNSGPERHPELLYIIALNAKNGTVLFDGKGKANADFAGKDLCGGMPGRESAYLPGDICAFASLLKEKKFSSKRDWRNAAISAEKHDFIYSVIRNGRAGSPFAKGGGQEDELFGILDSAGGKGVKFTVTLPLHKADDALLDWADRYSVAEIREGTWLAVSNFREYAGEPS